MSTKKTKYVLLTTGKGGSGKSTLATNLAVLAGLEGQRVGIIDFDPQGSIARWYSKRKNSATALEISVMCRAPEAGEARTIAQHFAATHDLDIVFIDTQGTNNTASNELTPMADVVLMPLCPGGFDHLASRNNIGRISNLRDDQAAWVVFNQCPATSSREARNLRAAWKVNRPRLNISKRFIPIKKVFRSAAESGLGIVELEPGDNTSRQMRDLAIEIGLVA